MHEVGIDMPKSPWFSCDEMSDFAGWNEDFESNSWAEVEVALYFFCKIVATSISFQYIRKQRFLEVWRSLNKRTYYHANFGVNWTKA